MDEDKKVIDTFIRKGDKEGAKAYLKKKYGSAGSKAYTDEEIDKQVDTWDFKEPNEQVKRAREAREAAEKKIEVPGTKVPSPPGGSSAPGGTTNPLMTMIAKGESAPGRAGYDVSYANVKSPKPLTEMTLAEVQDWQKQLPALSTQAGAKTASSAVGKWQMMPATLAEGIKALNLDPNTTKFTPEIQDKIIENRLRSMRGLDKFVQGQIDSKEMQRNLSKEFASIPDPDTGKSYYNTEGKSYAEFGGTPQPVAHTNAEVQAALAKYKENPNGTSLADLSKETGPSGGVPGIYKSSDDDKNYFTGKLSALDGMDAGMVEKLKAVVRKTGKKLQITSGYRSQEYQDKLRAAAVKKYGSEKAASKWVAKTSIHSTGNAVDISGADRSADAYWQANPDVVKAMEEQGLHRPLGHESWHWENDITKGAENRAALARRLIDQREKMIRSRTNPTPAPVNPQDAELTPLPNVNLPDSSKSQRQASLGGSIDLNIYQRDQWGRLTREPVQHQMNLRGNRIDGEYSIDGINQPAFA